MKAHRLPAQAPWHEMRTLEQNKLLQVACEDLARSIKWHGHKLNKDDWRHFIAATILGERLLPGIPRGDGPPGWVRLGRSSKELRKSQCTDAIQLIFALGDAPWEYDDTQPPGLQVQWGPIVRLARGFRDYENEIERQRR